MLTSLAVHESHLNWRMLLCKGCYFEWMADICIDSLPSLGRLNCWCRPEVIMKGDKDRASMFLLEWFWLQEQGEDVRQGIPLPLGTCSSDEVVDTTWRSCGYLCQQLPGDFLYNWLNLQCRDGSSKSGNCCWMSREKNESHLFELPRHAVLSECGCCCLK